MNRIIILCLALLCWSGIGTCQAQNKALRLDGKDDNVRTGIGFLRAPWTLETWIKGDDRQWKDKEIIFGGGENSIYTWVDDEPLTVSHGKVYSTRARLTSTTVLDDQWHHVALTCDGQATRLFVDGVQEAERDTAVTVIPGALGVNLESKSVLGGYLDEVRVWQTALSPSVLKAWMGRPIDPSHPAFGKLTAYYNFDAGIDDTTLNWMGSGYHSYHLRNGRIEYNSASELAHAEEARNPHFSSYQGRQQLFNAIAIESEWDADQDARDDQIVKLRVIVQGQQSPMRMEAITLDLGETQRLQDITALHIYYTGKVARSSRRDLIATVRPAAQIKVSVPKALQTVLTEGANYFLVTADIAANAELGDRIRVQIPSCRIGGKTVRPEQPDKYIFKEVCASAATDPDVFRLMQWNIWHGGRHLPYQGRTRIVELLKATHADIITMQEAYGSQHFIASALGYNMQTPSPTDNLCLYSRFPLLKQRSTSTFCSNPGIVDMGHGRRLLVNDCWLPYSYNPVYTGCFPEHGLDPKVWIAEDSVRTLTTLKKLMDSDMKPVISREDMPMIIAGDFNSCSHLDWTLRTASLHGGYGPVDFPVSRYMYRLGFKDSFREAHPDELQRPEGTFAGIFAQLDFNRIDFIYYKGNLQVLSSKVIQTSPEIDDVWASDHSAVLTTFKWTR